jgi:hypothetical protein
MNITLDSTFKIQADARQWILVEDDRAISYFSDLESLVQEYFKRKLRTSDSKTISQLLEYHKQCLNTLKHALTPLQIRVEGENSLVRPNKIKLPKNQTLNFGGEK